MSCLAKFPALVLLLLLLFHPSDSIHGGFTARLIHRDSPLLPSYDPTATHFERMRDAFRRSFIRVSHRFRRSNLAHPTTQGGLVLSGGEYYLNISIGTPAAPLVGIADTGSDLTWSQCKPCVQCYKQIPPLFDPTLSSSYRPIQCSTKDCRALKEAGCGKDHAACVYNYSYADSSFTSGNLAFETITVGSASGDPLHIQNVEFGCGTDNEGIFDPIGSGIIGLGGGTLSLITQLKKNSIPAKFSYCLAYNDRSGAASKINFGGSAAVSGPGTVSTPLVSKAPASYYYITLEAVSVGNQRFESRSAASATKDDDMVGNMVIDSGTTMTFIPQDLYQKTLTAVEKTFVAERAKDPGGIMSVCWKTMSDENFPAITFHFTGADVVLEPKNTVSFADSSILCFTIEANNFPGAGTYGNLAQADFLVGYDLESRSLSLQKTDCSKTM